MKLKDVNQFNFKSLKEMYSQCLEKKGIMDIYLNRLKDSTKRLSVMHIRIVPFPSMI